MRISKLKNLITDRTFLLKVILILIPFFVGFYFRSFNIGWDKGYYFHPDERAIVMFVVDIKMPQTFNEFLSSDSSLNPKFFAYGNFPLYLLKGTAEVFANLNPLLREYAEIYKIGRNISALFDSLSIIIVFLIARKLFSFKLGILAALIYALSVLPIQLSHFFAVDTILTFFLTISLLFALNLYDKPNYKNSLFLGTSFGFALATKISAMVFAPTIALVFALLLFIKKVKFLSLINYSLVITITTALFFVVTQPYTILDFAEFKRQIILQTTMSKDPFLFPYTLQYVGKIKYFHEIKNIFLWGLGPIITFFSITGLILCLNQIMSDFKKSIKLTIVVFYFVFYFVLFGSFAVGWMRYMLPIYPLMAIFAALSIFKLVQKIKQKDSSKLSLLPNITTILIFTIILIYPLSFISVYSRENPRIQATNWIFSNIPYGSTLAVEHWDDALPIYGADIYNMPSLPIYDEDTTLKWEQINETINQSDYIIIASNRLYTPLQKLTNCGELPPGKCYPRTAEYYRMLLSEDGFKKVKEFTSYPTVPILNWEINDQSADENFTVFDHPKIMIFRKIK